MKRIVNGFWLLCIAVVFFSSCNDDFSQPVDQDRIYTIYELYYNQSADETRARVTFKFGNSAGTLMELNEKASIVFQPQNESSEYELAFRADVAIYEKVFDGLLSAGTFRFTDADGDMYTNNISVTPVNLPDSLAPLTKGQEWNLTWQGESLAEHESISLTFNSVDGESSETFYQGSEGSSQFALSPDQTGLIKKGNNMLIMDRRYQPETINAPSAGGALIGRYRPEGRQIQVIDE